MLTTAQNFYDLATIGEAAPQETSRPAFFEFSRPWFCVNIRTSLILPVIATDEDRARYGVDLESYLRITAGIAIYGQSELLYSLSQNEMPTPGSIEKELNRIADQYAQEQDGGDGDYWSGIPGNI